MAGICNVDLRQTLLINSASDRFRSVCHGCVDGIRPECMYPRLRNVGVLINAYKISHVYFF
jgi:hypothetical protein